MSHNYSRRLAAAVFAAIVFAAAVFAAVVFAAVVTVFCSDVTTH